MTQKSQETERQDCAGADGCRAGWIVATGAGPDPAIAVHPHLADLIAGNPRLLLAIDMPFGLPALVGPGGRAPERLVRPLLGGRQSSVFAVPARAAVFAEDYGAACAAALATSDPPRKVSKQCFHLFPKMRELDSVLRAEPALREQIFEAHPEVSFWRLNGERPLDHPKKVKGRPWPPGLTERRAILTRAGFSTGAVMARPPSGAGEDDLLDALANLATARRIAGGTARPFPDPPERDAFGLPIAIWA